MVKGLRTRDKPQESIYFEPCAASNKGARPIDRDTGRHHGHSHHHGRPAVNTVVEPSDVFAPCDKQLGLSSAALEDAKPKNQIKRKLGLLIYGHNCKATPALTRAVALIIVGSCVGIQAGCSEIGKTPSELVSVSPADPDITSHVQNDPQVGATHQVQITDYLNIRCSPAGAVSITLEPRTSTAEMHFPGTVDQTSTALTGNIIIPS